MTSPAVLPAITPPSVMVAMLLSELLQEPPVLGVAVIVEFTQVTSEEVFTTGNGLTVIEVEVVFEQPVAESVKVKVTSPADLTAITPPSVIVAMLLSELLQTPPVIGNAVIVEFTQVKLDEVLTSGNGCTVTELVVVFEHPVTESV